MDSSEASKDKGRTIGIRHVQVLFLFLHLVFMYHSRMNVSIALVAMTDAEKANPDFPEYDWTETEKGYVLSSFYWGYILTQFPSSFFIRYFGVKLTLFIGEVGSGLLALTMPIGIEWGGWQAYFGLRVVQGLFQGVLFPSMYAHLANWSPKEERTRLGAIAHFGIDVGTIVSAFIPGLIAASDIGWPGLFYVAGGINIAIGVLWMIFGADHANESRFISAAEREYIESSLERNENFHKEKIPVPWKAIFTSVPFYSQVAVRSACMWGFVTVQVELPLYLHGIHGLDIKQNAFYSSLPYVLMFIMSNVNLIIADVILQKKLMSLTALRKTFNTVAFFVTATVLVIIGFLDEEHKYVVIALITVSVGLYSGITIGCLLNIIDLAPNHAGMMMGVVNPFISTIAIIVPIIAGKILDVGKANENALGAWQIIFGIATVFLVVGNVQYLIWGTAETQPWNEPDYMENEKKKQQQAG